MSCGCTWDKSPTFVIHSNTSTTANVGDTRTVQGFWLQPSFPNAQCISPHTIRAEWFEVGVSSNYAIISTSAPIKWISGTASGNIGPFPASIIVGYEFTKAGTFRIRTARPVCGPNFASSVLEVAVLDTAVTRFISTGASIL